jgi:hypothetical protein
MGNCGSVKQPNDEKKKQPPQLETNQNQETGDKPASQPGVIQEDFARIDLQKQKEGLTLMEKLKGDAAPKILTPLTRFEKKHLPFCTLSCLAFER